MDKLKYDKVKQKRNNQEDEIVLTKKIYNVETGEIEEEKEFNFDPSIINDRIANLQTEIENLKTLQYKITNNQFDEIIDKRKSKN